MPPRVHARRSAALRDVRMSVKIRSEGSTRALDHAVGLDDPLVTTSDCLGDCLGDQGDGCFPFFEVEEAYFCWWLLG